MAKQIIAMYELSDNIIMKPAPPTELALKAAMHPAIGLIWSKDLLGKWTLEPGQLAGKAHG